jgi:mRNA interferase MazF
MPNTTSYNPGEILLVPFPFTDQTTNKKRPAVVISSTAYNRTRPDLIIMAVTSQIKNDPAIGEFQVQDWEGAGLLKPSVIKPVITTIEKQLVIKTLGNLQPADLRSLHQSLQAVIGQSDSA